MWWGPTFRDAQTSGDNYAVGKKLRKTYKGNVAPLPYDATWLVELAQSLLPEETQIIESLRKTTTIVGFCSCGCGKPYFIDPRSRDWNFGENITLLGDGKTVILTVLKDKRVASIEVY